MCLIFRYFWVQFSTIRVAFFFYPEGFKSIAESFPQESLVVGKGSWLDEVGDCLLYDIFVSLLRVVTLVLVSRFIISLVPLFSCRNSSTCTSP